MMTTNAAMKAVERRATPALVDSGEPAACQEVGGGEEGAGHQSFVRHHQPPLLPFPEGDGAAEWPRTGQ